MFFEIYILKFLLIFICVYGSVPACLYMHYLHEGDHEIQKEGNGSPGTGSQVFVSYMMLVLGQNSSSLQEPQVLLTTEPLFLPPNKS